MDLTTILPYVISGIICVGVWAGALGNREVGWSICILGHLSFMMYGVYSGRHGFFIVPPFTATGLVVSIVRERRRRRIIDSTPGIINIEGQMNEEARCS